MMLIAWLRGAAGDENAALVAAREALAAARQAGSAIQIARCEFAVCASVTFGATPALHGLKEIRSIVADATSKTSRALIHPLIAVLEAYRGNVDEAMRAIDETDAIYDDLGRADKLGTLRGFAQLWLDQNVEALQTFRSIDAELARAGNTSIRATVAAMLAEALRRTGNADEALESAKLSAALENPDDIESGLWWRSVQARILSDRGSNAEAEHLAREAVALAAPTQWPERRGVAALDLARVLFAAGRIEEARPAAHEARRAFEEKELLAGTRMVDDVLAQLSSAETL